jgi:hypothetical protein
VISATRYNASVHLTLHLTVDAPSIEEVSATVRDIVSMRPGVREIDISGVVVSPMSVTELLQRDNLVTWQEMEAIRLGTEDQRARYAVGALPDEELCRIARSVLFTAFDGFTLRRRLTAAAIGHPKLPGSQVWRCVTLDAADGPVFPVPVTWSTMPSPVLTPSEWQTLTRMNLAVNDTNHHPWLVDAPVSATIATRIHKGVCQRCQREAAQASALVTVAWAGRTLSREYVL